MTPWSDWSPCSVSCGKGMRERFRMFLRKAGTDRCSQSRMEKEVCMSSIIDCDKATMMKNFTAVCSQRGDRGLCRGRFPRWYYDTTMRKCLPFDYTGCRGNDNNFETQKQCDQLCGVHMASLHTPSNDGTGVELGEPDALKLLMMKKQMMMKQQQEREQRERQEWEARQRAPKVDCMVTPWSDWTPCSVSCGKGITTKLRMVKIEPQNGGRKCPRRLMKKKKCRRRKCAIDCRLSKWTKWSYCNKTCGNNVIQQRKRRVMKRPKHGGRPCDPTLERRYCNLPSCPNQKPGENAGPKYYYPMSESGL